MPGIQAPLNPPTGAHMCIGYNAGVHYWISTCILEHVLCVCVGCAIYSVCVHVLYMQRECVCVYCSFMPLVNVICMSIVVIHKPRRLRDPLLVGVAPL